MLTVLESPLTTRLTSYAAIVDALKLNYDDDRLVIEGLIEAASDLIRHHDLIRQSFARTRYRETLTAWDGRYLVLSEGPVVSIEQVLYRSAAVSSTEYTLVPTAPGRAPQRALYRARGWATAESGAVYPLLSSPGDLVWQIDYTAGYLLPEDNRDLVTTWSAVTLTNSYSDSAAHVPLLIAGERPVLAGFTTVGNNGTPTVVSRTASTLVVSGLTITDEAAGDEITVTCRTLPHDLERQCIELVRSMYLERQWDLTGPHVVDTGGGTRLLNRAPAGMPTTVLEGLRPYVRTV